MILSIDAMGGDNAPKAILEGADLALTNNPALRFLLHGDGASLNQLLEKMPALKATSTICHTDKAIAMDEAPAIALRKEGRQSSMWLALESVRDGKADVAISAGNTGALMGMAKLVLKTLDGIDRPAMAARWPNRKNSLNLILDLGATISPTAQQLIQFAAMGIAAAKPLIGVENPKIGLLNVGTEDIKGPLELRQAATLCKSLFPNNFCGFIEGDDIASGTIDVIITDGFSGNIALKSAEGTSRFVFDLIREQINRNLRGKIGGLLLRPAFRALYNRIDPNNYNGAVFLGLKGLVLKSHGGCGAYSFSIAISVANAMHEANLIERIKNTLPQQKLKELTTIKQAS